MRLQIYIIGGILAFGILTGIYYSWRKSIEREALLEYNQAQIEQNIKDQQAMREKLDAMAAKQKEIEDLIAIASNMESNTQTIQSSAIQYEQLNFKLNNRVT